MASELSLEWEVGEAKPQRSRAGDGVLGEGAASPLPTDMGFVRAL